MHAREQIGSGTIPIIVLFSSSIPRGWSEYPFIVTAHREFHSRQKFYSPGPGPDKMQFNLPACMFPNGLSLILQPVVMFLFNGSTFQSENNWNLNPIQASAVGVSP